MWIAKSQSNGLDLLNAYNVTVWTHRLQSTHITTHMCISPITAALEYLLIFSTIKFLACLGVEYTISCLAKSITKYAMSYAGGPPSPSLICRANMIHPHSQLMKATQDQYTQIKFSGHDITAMWHVHLLTASSSLRPAQWQKLIENQSIYSSKLQIWELILQPSVLDIYHGCRLQQFCLYSSLL